MYEEMHSDHLIKANVKDLEFVGKIMATSGSGRAPSSGNPVFSVIPGCPITDCECRLNSYVYTQTLNDFHRLFEQSV